VAIPVALATGRTVIGIDSSPAMLAQARTAAAAAGVALDMVICQIVLLMLGSLLDAASRTSPGPARYATPLVPSLRLAGAATERRYEPSPTAGLTAAPNHGSRAQGSGEPTLLPQRDRSAGRSIIGDLTQRSASDQSRGAWRRPPLGRMRPSGRSVRRRRHVRRSRSRRSARGQLGSLVTVCDHVLYARNGTFGAVQARRASSLVISGEAL
jgi:hypothetical protein